MSAAPSTVIAWAALSAVFVVLTLKREAYELGVLKGFGALTLRFKQRD